MLGEGHSQSAPIAEWASVLMKPNAACTGPGNRIQTKQMQQRKTPKGQWCSNPVGRSGVTAG
jgi:hypothetical protein